MSKSKIMESEYGVIIDLYKSGLTQIQIADRYNVCRDVIKRILKKCGISHIDKPQRFSDNERRIICDLYESGKTTEEIGKMYHVTDESVRRWLTDWGICLRHRKYTFDEHYFDIIDNQDKAYILGLLYADGYHNVAENMVVLKLQASDRHILYAINDALRNDKPLQFDPASQKNPNNSDYYQLSFISKYTSAVLEAHGLVGAKSLILQFPEWLDCSLYPHFIRGYFDGDGHISRGKYKYNMSIVGTEAFCLRIQDILYKELGIESKLYIATTVDKPTRILMITRKHLNKLFFDWIYKDANLYLQRKYDAYISKYCSEENINNTSVDVANQQSNNTEKTLNLSA